MKNGLKKFKYKGCGHYELREVCVYIIPCVISGYKRCQQTPCFCILNKYFLYVYVVIVCVCGLLLICL